MQDQEMAGPRPAGFARASCARGARIALLLSLLSAAGCNKDEFWDAFRSGASDQVQAGIETILLGVSNGVFNAIDTKDGDSGSANTSGATTGSSSGSTPTGSGTGGSAADGQTTGTTDGATP